VSFTRHGEGVRWHAGKEPGILHGADASVRTAWAAAQMRCRGCAAKVGAQTLDGVLHSLADDAAGHGVTIAAASLDAPARLDVSRDDAALIAGPPPGHVLLQTVDFVNACVSDAHLFGRIAAVHALSDCFAMGAQPADALAIAQVRCQSDCARQIVSALTDERLMSYLGQQLAQNSASSKTCWSLLRPTPCTMTTLLFAQRQPPLTAKLHRCRTLLQQCSARRSSSLCTAHCASCVLQGAASLVATRAPAPSLPLALPLPGMLSRSVSCAKVVFVPDSTWCAKRFGPPTGFEQHMR
jgi:hypothetical protein